MRAVFVACALVAAGCYDLDSFPGLFMGDAAEVVDGSVPPDPKLALVALAGQSGGRFIRPQGLCSDGNDGAFVVDTTAEVITHVSLTSGEVTLVAGVAMLSGSADGTRARAHFYGGRSCAVGEGLLYIADSGNNLMRVVDPATGVVSTLAGAVGSYGATDGTGSGARFSELSALLWRKGELYIAEDGTHLVRKMTPGGDVVTIAGAAYKAEYAEGAFSAARFRSPEGIAGDDGGPLYIADSNNRVIRVLDEGTMQTSLLAGMPGNATPFDGTFATATFEVPQQMVLVGDKLYVSETGACLIRRLDLTAHTVATVAGTKRGYMDANPSSAQFSTPAALVAYDDAIYVADRDNGAIRKLVPASTSSAGSVGTVAGAPASRGAVDGDGLAARFLGPTGIATDGTQWFVADTANHAVRLITLDGKTSTLAGDPTKAGDDDGALKVAHFRRPYGLAARGNGSIYVSDVTANVIRVIRPDGVSTLAGSAGVSGMSDGTKARFNAPAGLALDGSTLWIADSGNDALRTLDLKTLAVSTVRPTAAGGVLRGCASVDALSSPTGLAIDTDKRVLYVAATGNCQVIAVPLDGGTTTVVAAAPDDPTFAPTALAYDAGTGDLYVADASNATVRRVRIGEGSMTTIAGVAGQLGVALGEQPAALSQVGGLAFLRGQGLAITTPLENAVFLLR